MQKKALLLTKEKVVEDRMRWRSGNDIQNVLAVLKIALAK
jgi:hypothetical protein